MADDIKVVEATTEPTEPVVENKEEDKKEPVVKLDRDKPLRGQVDKLLSQLPPEEEKKEDVKSEDDPKEEPKTEDPKVEDVKTPDPEPEEDDTPIKELPAWQKYVYDGLPDIQVVGHEGDNKDKVYTIKRAEELPDDFEFASKRAELIFNASLSSQELNARELLQKYNAEQQQNQYQELKNQEALDIQKDITALQKEGVLPKFQHDEDDPKFNDDPAVKEANAIYDLYEKRNNTYAKNNQAYRITYADAADIYYARQSRERPNKVEPKPEVKAERDKVANQVSAPSGATTDSAKRGMPPGSSMQDVLKLYKLGRI
jgi:hypothetical protein